MTLVGFNFTKIFGEKKHVSDQNIRIENNVGITNVEESNVIDPKRTLVRYSFSFDCRYEPGLGLIELKGELVEMYDKEVASRIVEGWKKDKKLYPDIMSRILNTVVSRSNVEAILMSRELQLPPPIQLPKVEVKPKSAADAVVQSANDAKASKKEDKKDEKKEEKKTEDKKVEKKK